MENFDVNVQLKRAIKLFDKGRLDKAEDELNDLYSRLGHRSDFATRQASVAEIQKAAIHLFLGSIAAARHAPRQAIAEFEKTLNITKDGKTDKNTDTDALKYIAEQYLVLCGLEPTIRGTHANDALARAQELRTVAKKSNLPSAQKKYVEGDALRLQANAYLMLRQPDKAKELAEEGIGIAKWENEHDALVAELRLLHGRACLMRKLPFWGPAETSLRISVERYDIAGETEKAARARKLLQRAIDKDNSGSGGEDDHIV